MISSHQEEHRCLPDGHFVNTANEGPLGSDVCEEDHGMAVPVVLQHLYTLVIDWLTERSNKDDLKLKLGVVRSFEMWKVLYRGDGDDADGNQGIVLLLD